MFKKSKIKELDISSINKIIKIFLFISVIAAILLVTYLIQEWNVVNIIKIFFVIISPLIFGIIIAWLFEPLADYLYQKKVPRFLSCFIPYVVIWGVFFVSISFLLPTFVDQLIDFVDTIPGIFSDVSNSVENFLDNTLSSELFSVEEEAEKVFSNIASGLTTSLPDIAISLGSGLFTFGFNIFLSLMIGFYLLFDFHKFNSVMYKVTPVKWRSGAVELTSRINSSLRGYVQGVLLIMLLIFISQSIGLTLAGLDAPLVFALFCALTNVIPYFGPYIGGIPAVIVGFTISPAVGIGVIISIVVVQLLENSFFQPLIMGHTMKLHPVVIMISLLIFQQMFGIVGMIVATPIVATIKVIFMFIDEKIDIFNKFSKIE